MSWRQLLQQVLHLEEHPVHLDAVLGRGHRGRAESQRLQFLHDYTLGFLGQTDEFVVEAELDERLRELPREIET